MSPQAERRREPRPLPGLTFDPAIEGVGRAFERYTQLYAAGADVRATGADFYAHVEAQLLPGAALFRRTLRGLEHRRERPRIVRDGFEHLTLQLVDSGSLSLDADGRDHRLVPGEGVLVDMTRPFRSVATGRLFTLSIPRRRFQEAGLEPSALHGSPLAGDGGRLWKLLAANIETSREDGDVDAILEAVFARARREGTPRGRSTEARRERALRFIEDSLADPDLSPSRIAAAAGLSRATLYRAFQPLGGVSDWIQTRRLLRVRALLSRRDMSISEAGRSAGFVNASHLAFAFQARFGSPPSALRRRRSGGGLLPTHGAAAAAAALADMGAALADAHRDVAAA